MSVYYERTLTCPHCGQQNNVLVWSTLNAQVNPEAKTGLLEGRINVFSCNGCGETVRILKTLLYHDMKLKFMVYYFPFEFINDKSRMGEFGRNGTLICEEAEFNRLEKSGYSALHYVLDMKEMVRYIRFRDVLAGDNGEASSG